VLVQQITQTCDLELHLNCMFVPPAVGTPQICLGSSFLPQVTPQCDQDPKTFQVTFVEPAEKEEEHPEPPLVE
jgi:hypothetical protein